MADHSHIPDEAVTAAQEAGNHAYRDGADDATCWRLGLAAALPVLNTTKDSEIELLRAEKDRYWDGIMRIAALTCGDTYGLADDALTDIEAAIAHQDGKREDLLREVQQHRSGESYEIGENYGRTTQANECVRDLLAAVYPGDPMPDRPLDTIWNHLLEQVRKYVVELDEVRRQLRIYTAGAQRCGNRAVHKGCARVLKHDGGCSTYPLSDVDKAAASLRGEQ